MQPPAPVNVQNPPSNQPAMGQDAMMQQILQHILDTHKQSQQQTSSVNSGLLGLLKQQGQPQAPAAPQGPMPGGM